LPKAGAAHHDSPCANDRIQRPSQEFLLSDGKKMRHVALLEESTMALTYTPAPELGAPCPDFKLPAVEGRTYARGDFEGARAFLVMFICNHCPYVKAIEERLLALGHAYAGQPVKIVAVCANDADRYPDDSFEAIQKRWKEKAYPFPYLYDDSQETARAFGAVCTPDFFLYDGEMKLAYRGRLDDSWKEPSQVKSQELKAAIDALLADQQPSANQIPSMGCSIKWKAGN
jgi:thiol-disulfide isomerase/thioredoxin